MAKHWRALALLGVALMMAVGLSFVPWMVWLEGFEENVKALGPGGPALFVLAYVAAVVLLVPAAPLTVLGGIAFGGWAFPLVAVAATSGAVLAFLIARYLLRERVRKLLAHRGKLAAIDKAVGQGGWKMVGLLRLSPLVPFTLQNYVLGTTGVGFLDYVMGTSGGILPGTLLYVYLGAAGKYARGGLGPAQWTLLGLGFVATVVLTFWITRVAKHRLAKRGLD